MRALIWGLSGVLLGVCALAQDVTSARSGVIHYSEGAVSIDGRALEHKPGAFAIVASGETISTAKGRAELLLTPGVVLRMDENAAALMVSNSLADTRIELQKGSALLDTVDAPGPSPVTMVFRERQIRFLKPGVYRIDADPAVLQAYSGEAEVSAPGGKVSRIDTAKLYFFDLGTVTNKFGEPNEDEFYDWARERYEVLSARNQLATQAGSDAGPDPGVPPILIAPVPYAGGSPGYALGYGGWDPSYASFNPFLAWNADPFLPYRELPVLVLERRRYHSGTWAGRPGGTSGGRPGGTPGRTYAGWPHRPVTAGLSPVHPGVARGTIRYPIAQPRTFYSAPAPRFARPATMAPARPTAPPAGMRTPIRH